MRTTVCRLLYDFTPAEVLHGRDEISAATEALLQSFVGPKATMQVGRVGGLACEITAAA